MENEGAKSLEKIVVFISVNTFGACGTNCKALKPSRAIIKNPGVWTNNFSVVNAKT